MQFISTRLNSAYIIIALKESITVTLEIPFSDDILLLFFKERLGVSNS